jgi:uncharacterized protein YraI
MKNRSILALTAASLLAAAPALAEVSATAATDLNFRAGPGGDQQILGVIPAGGEVTVLGCLEASSWCQVDVQGTQGWAFGDYLNATVEEQQVVVIENREPLAVENVTFTAAETDATADAVEDVAGATVGAGAGAAIAAALIGGPAAIAAGAALGAAAGAVDEPAVTYVQQNPVDPVYLDGEVIVGAGIPEEVEIIQVPDTNYGYLNVNGLPVVVDNESRQIVQIIRSE